MKWIPIAALLVVAGAAAATEPLTREALEQSFFQSIGVKQGDPPQLLLHFKTSGTRFLCSRNDQDEKVNDYDEVMAVNPGDTFSVSEHHTGLEFRPLPKPYEKHGWLLESDIA